MLARGVPGEAPGLQSHGKGRAKSGRARCLPAPPILCTTTGKGTERTLEGRGPFPAAAAWGKVGLCPPAQPSPAQGLSSPDHSPEGPASSLAVELGWSPAEARGERSPWPARTAPQEASPPSPACTGDGSGPGTPVGPCAPAPSQLQLSKGGCSSPNFSMGLGRGEGQGCSCTWLVGLGSPPGFRLASPPGGRILLSPRPGGCAQPGPGCPVSKADAGAAAEREEVRQPAPWPALLREDPGSQGRGGSANSYVHRAP